MELNPNHPMTVKMHDQWHKIAALLMLKFNVKEVRITSSEIGALALNPTAVTVQVEQSAKEESILLKLVPLSEGKQIAIKEGGLPH